jgi:flagellar basal body P-ring protein FlgI
MQYFVLNFQDLFSVGRKDAVDPCRRKLKAQKARARLQKLTRSLAEVVALQRNQVKIMQKLKREKHRQAGLYVIKNKYFRHIIYMKLYMKYK